MKVRLNKFLSESGIASRRKSEEYILQGRIAVNNKIVTDLSCKIDPDTDSISFDGELLKTAKKVYFLLNKPKGYITTTSDERKRKTVVDLIKTNFKIFPVGRLDYNTTGVLLLTNDGEFANKLTHPSNKIEREYIATLNKPLKYEDQIQLSRNIILDGRKSKFTEIELVKKSNQKIVRVVTVEGRNHFVKRMFAALGYRVEKLHRSRFGEFTVEGLMEGEYKKINL